MNSVRMFPSLRREMRRTENSSIGTKVEKKGTGTKTYIRQLNLEI